MYFKNNSTIFKTKQDLTTGKTSVKPSGFGGVFTGDFWKKKSVIGTDDITAIKKYNAEISRGVMPSIAFHKTMKNTSTTAQNLVKSANGVVDTINGIPKVSKAATVGMKLLSGAMNVVTTLIISTLISGIGKMINASEEMSQQASEATSKYKEQATSIDEYKNKITELKTALSDENISYADARDKRSQLLDIQKQLIDTYGTEASGINLVNGSLDDQIEKLDTLNKQKRQQWENEVNKLSTGQQWQKWGGAIGWAALDFLTLDWSFQSMDDWLADFDNTTNIERIQEKVENFKKSISLSDLDLDAEELEGLKTQLDSFKGISFKGNQMTISGDAKTVSETVRQIQTQIIGSREDLQDLNQDLKDIHNSAQKIVDENWDTYNQAIENQIVADDTGLEYYGKLTEAYETYQKAVKDGDEKTINEAKESYAKILSDIDGSDMSDSFKKFFENMYLDISDIVSDWKFEVEIVPKINKNTDGLKDDIETVKALTTEEISAAFENNGTGVSKDEWKAIANLNAEAQANGLDLTTFLEQLREAGYLVSQLDKDIEKVVNDTKNKYGDGVDWGKYFKDNSIDTQEEIDKWNEVTNGIDNAEDAMNAYAEATKEAVDISSLLKDFNEEVDEIQDAYNTLSSAVEEYNTTGHMSLDTVQKLLSLEPQYLALLINENGQLSLNEQSMRDLLTARLEETKAKIFENGINQINALTAQKTGTASKEAAGKKADAVEDIEEETNALNDNTEAKLKNVAAQAVDAGVSQEEVDSIVNATIAQATALESAVNGLNIDFGGTVGGGNKKSSSKKNEALDNYLKDAENRYKVHQNETKYIEELNYALSNLVKTEDEELDVIGKVNEAYRDLADNRIKDLEHRVDLKKELYGEDYDVTNEWSEIQRIAEEEADRLRAMGYDDNSNEIQDLQKTWWDAENKKLDFYSKQHEIILRDIEHARDMALNADEDTDVSSYYKQLQAEYHKEAERLRALDPEKYKERIQELQQLWWDAEENIWDNNRKIFDDRLALSEDYIQHSNNFGWENGDSEIAARKRVLDWIESDYYRSLIKDDEEYYDILAENRLKYQEALKELTQELFNELQTELDKSYDIRISRLNSRSSLLSSHYDILNTIKEEQHNLNKELLEAETIGARMNEQERESLFTKQEHTRLSGKLNDIMLDITDLQGDYQRDLDTATEDTIEEITNHYERQYELKMKEYEIVRAELNLIKKRQILENVENEKSVRTWNGSNWIYEANLQNVLDAQEDVENAKYEFAKAQREEAQQTALNAIDASADALQTEKNRLSTAIGEMAEKMDGSGKEITDILKTIAETDLPTFDAILHSLGDALKNSFGISDETIQLYRLNGQSGSKSLVEEMQDNSVKWHTASKDEQSKLAERNQEIGNLLGLDYDESTGRWKNPDGTYAYANGTKNAHKGFGLFDEEGLGSEFILTKDGVLTQFQGGEHVFSPEMADKLWEMAQQNYNFAPVISQPNFGKLTPIDEKINNAISNISNAFGDTYMIKDVQLNESEGGTLKGFMNFLKKKI